MAESTQPRVGFIGVGAMGGPMARSLMRAGYPLQAHDLNPDRLAECVTAGAARAESVQALLAASDVVLTSLPSSQAWVQAADESLVPGARSGQLFVDMGTVTPPETRRIAAALAAKSAALVEAPVSGGPYGAEHRELLVFAGGDDAAFERARPLLEAITQPQWITYCGPAGCGQVVKGVNQLMMGLGAAAYLEAIAFGARCGVPPEVLRQAVAPQEGFRGAWRRDYAGVADRVAAGEGMHIGVKFRELPYFLREAAEQGRPLPLTEALYHFCDAGERVVIDDNRQAPSFWWELTREHSQGES